MENTQHHLLITARHAEQYHRQILESRLPALNLVDAPGPQVDIVLGQPDLVRNLLPDLPALAWVQSTWAGVEPLLDPSLRRDYILTNARGVFGGLMSEFVFGYLLFHERKILQRLEAQVHSTWDASLTGTLRGKTLGLLGVGSIGAHLASTAKHFGMRVHGYTRDSETCAQVDRYFHADRLQDFASGLDMLVNVLPGTALTRKIIDAGLLAALPAGAIFINAGRGNAVDGPALINALDVNHLALAVLDVFEEEPLPTGHPFWRTKNLLISSHTAAPSFPADITALFIENYRLYARGETVKYRVNFTDGY